MAIPTNDAQLVPYINSFYARLEAQPSPYPVTPEQLSRLAGLRIEYVGACEAIIDARERGIRSEALTATKDAARKELLKYARGIYAAVAGSPDLSPAAKINLGVHIRDTNPTPTPPPTATPRVEVQSVVGHAVNVRLGDSAEPRSNKLGASGAYVYSFVGAEYPTDPMRWTFEGQATKADYTVNFAEEVEPGSQVWVCCAFINRKGQAGPVSLPVTARIQFGMKTAA